MFEDSEDIKGVAILTHTHTPPSDIYIYISQLKTRNEVL